VVNFSDITSVLSNWGSVSCLASGDANATGTIDFSDITSVLSNWGAICSTSALAPGEEGAGGWISPRVEERPMLSLAQTDEVPPRPAIYPHWLAALDERALARALGAGVRALEPDEPARESAPRRP